MKAGYFDKHFTSLEIIPGNNAPVFRVTDLEEKEFELSDYLGSFLFLEFWVCSMHI